MPSPKDRSTPVTGQQSAKSPQRPFVKPDLPIIWANERAFSAQPEKKKWQENLVRSRKAPSPAATAIIREGVHISSDDPEGVRHITVEYLIESGEHETTWHLDLTEAECLEFQELRPKQAEPEPAPAVVEAWVPSSSPTWDSGYDSESSASSWDARNDTAPPS
jgi:hypothetical protein